MMDDKIKDIFQRYGRTVTGYDYALVHATAEAVSSKRTWVGLTDEEIIIMSRYDLEYAALIGEVQRKLKEKNGYA